jgi:hypothetical protein
LDIGQKLILNGKYNLLGFYANSYEAEKSSIIKYKLHERIPFEMGASIVTFDNGENKLIFEKYNKP